MTGVIYVHKLEPSSSQGVSWNGQLEPWTRDVEFATFAIMDLLMSVGNDDGKSNIIPHH